MKRLRYEITWLGYRLISMLRRLLGSKTGYTSRRLRVLESGATYMPSPQGWRRIRPSWTGNRLRKVHRRMRNPEET